MGLGKRTSGVKQGGGEGGSGTLAQEVVELLYTQLLDLIIDLVVPQQGQDVVREHVRVCIGAVGTTRSALCSRHSI